MEPSEVVCPPLSALFSMRVSFGRSLNDVTTQSRSQGLSSLPPLSTMEAEKRGPCERG